MDKKDAYGIQHRNDNLFLESDPGTTKEFNGLIPPPPNSQEEAESYSDIFKVLKEDDRKSKSNNRENDLSKLPMMALEDIPKPNAGAKQIVALVKKSGLVTGYQLSDGKVLGKSEGVQLAKQGGIQGVGIATRNGNEYLKSLPDGSENNNLSNLPSITQ